MRGRKHEQSNFAAAWLRCTRRPLSSLLPPPQPPPSLANSAALPQHCFLPFLVAAAPPPPPIPTPLATPFSQDSPHPRPFQHPHLPRTASNPVTIATARTPVMLTVPDTCAIVLYKCACERQRCNPRYNVFSSPIEIRTIDYFLVFIKIVVTINKIK